MKNKTKKKFKNFLSKSNKELDNEEYKPKKFGTGKVTSFTMKGLLDCFCMAAEWPNGEGYDFSLHETSDNSDNSDKKISLHRDELKIMLACLNDLKYFE